LTARIDSPKQRLLTSIGLMRAMRSALRISIDETASHVFMCTLRE
jgi:hypothetical protein